MKKAILVLGLIAVLALSVVPVLADYVAPTTTITVNFTEAVDWMAGFWNLAAPVTWPLVGIGLVSVLFTLFQKARAMAGG